MKTLPVGLQLFTVRDEMAKSVPETLKAVKEAGYDYVEPAGLFGLSGEQFKEELDKAVQEQNFEYAAQLRDRIKELEAPST